MFHFELQTVLDVRKTLENKVLQEFSEQQREVRRQSDHLQAIQTQKRDLIDSLRNVQGKRVSAGEISMNAECIRGCLRNEANQKEQVENALRMAALKKEALFDAIKKRKSMEILKERQRSQHQFEVNLAEQTALDEIALARHNRKREE